MFAGLRVKTLKRGEQVVGLELHDIRIDSFLERLGIVSGDVLLRIAGEPVTDAGVVGELLQAHKHDDSLLVDLARNGEKYQLKLRVQVPDE